MEMQSTGINLTIGGVNIKEKKYQSSYGHEIYKSYINKNWSSLKIYKATYLIIFAKRWLNIHWTGG